MSSKKHWFILIIIIALIIALFMHRLGYFSAADEESGRSGPSVLSLEAEILERKEHRNTFKTSGDVRPGERVDLRAEISGKITSINFDEGTYVRKGQLLVKIDDVELQASLSRLQARKDVLAKREERQNQLLEIDAVSREVYENTYHELQGVKAEMKEVQARIDKAEIRAPFDGRIGIREVSPGSFISSDSRIASLVQLQPLKIHFTVPERYAHQVKEGDTVLFSVSGSNTQDTAVVSALQPYIDETTRSLRVQALYNNGDKTILPGSFVTVEITVSQDELTILVPSEAVIPEIDGHFVYLYNNGKARRQSIEIGQRLDARVLVNEGLSEGDTLLTTGILQLRPDIEVEISSFRN